MDDLKRNATPGGAGALPNSPLVPSVRGDLLEQAGQHAQASEAFTEAATRTKNEGERSLLRHRAEMNLTRTPKPHKPSDTRAVGAQGSEADRIARDLLHLADTKILLGQDQSVADELGDLLGLTSMTQDLVTGWAMSGKGRALWLVGDRKYKVQTVQHPLEKTLTFTNDAAAGNL